MNKAKAKVAFAWLIRAFSAYLAYEGLSLAVATSGMVQGSEFVMPISITHELALALLWLALLAIWHVMPATPERPT